MAKITTTAMIQVRRDKSDASAASAICAGSRIEVAAAVSRFTPWLRLRDFVEAVPTDIPH